jgi:uncharacterized Tic20 family protein
MSEEIVDVQEPVAREKTSPTVTRKLNAENRTPKPRARRPETRKLEPEAEAEKSLTVMAASPHLGLARDEMTWAAVAHASILLTLLLGVSTGGIAAILGPIVPAIIWYVFRDRSEYVVEQARQATIFQLAGILGLLALAIVGAILVAAGWVVSAVLIVVLVGLILMPVMLIVTLAWVAAVVALPIVQVVYGCYAALEAYNGRPFRYWWVADVIDRYQSEA